MNSTSKDLIKSLIQGQDNKCIYLSKSALLATVSNLSKKIQIEADKEICSRLAEELLIFYKIGTCLFAQSFRTVSLLRSAFQNDVKMIYSNNPSLLKKLRLCDDARFDLEQKDLEFIKKSDFFKKLFKRYSKHRIICDEIKEGIVSSHSQWENGYKSIYSDYDLELSNIIS